MLSVSRAWLARVTVALLFLSNPLALGGQPAQVAAPSYTAATTKPRTKAEVEAAIAWAGANAPDWYKTTPLNYPKTLDLTWMKPPPNTPWTPAKYLLHYMWSVINENPGKWKEGARLLHNTLEVNKADTEKLKQSMAALGTLYHNLLQDYARAAFWWRKAGYDVDEELADCYWRLGCKEMAKDVLLKYGDDDTRHGSLIKLWADMGETETALKLAETKAQDGEPAIGWLMAGEACRVAGRYKEALAYYEKTAAVPGEDKGDLKQSRERAKASIEAVKVFDLLDLKRIPDGTYTGSSYGYAGPLNLAVTVRDHRIQAVNVRQHQEKQPYNALTETPSRIIEKQSVKGIDTYSSATITSEAIINATAKALSSGMK
ncbi:MAG: FMN-binding protein [Planctomycetota bacterium]